MLRCAGVLTSDPRIVHGARPVPLLTYEEATELAFFGATVLHPLAMQPAIQSDSLAVRVKNSFNKCAAPAVKPLASVTLSCVAGCPMGKPEGRLGTCCLPHSRCGGRTHTEHCAL